MPKAISYIRFSSGRQGSGSTTGRQLALINKWLIQHPDIELSKLSQEDLGRSGYSGAHLQHGLGRILNAIEEDKICPGDFILVEAIDRIGRLEPLDMFSLIQNIVAKNVNIVTLEDNQEYSRDSLNYDFGPLYILIGKIQQAHSYSKTLSQRITAAYETKRRKARAGEKIRIITPFWLDKEGKLIPEKAEITKKCIELYLRGHGSRQIIIMLMDEHPELTGVHPTTLKRWFQHRALIGEWKNQGDHIPNVFEPLIDSATFYRLQKQVHDRAKVMSPEQTYELSGLIKCSQCGSRYYYRKKKHANYQITYANCSNFLKRGKPFCNNSKTWPYQVLMAIRDLTCHEYLATASYIHAETIVSGEVETLKAKRQELSTQIDKLLDILISIPNQQNTKDKIENLNEKINEIDIIILSKESSFIEGKFKTETLDENDFYYDNLIKIANDEISKIYSDPIYLRETLKKKSFEILGSHSIMTVNSGSAGTVEYNLLKRSQKHYCYIVKQYIPEHYIPRADEDGEFFYCREKNIFFAVNRDGIIAFAHSEEELLINLNKRSDEEPLALYFGKWAVDD